MNKKKKFKVYVLDGEWFFQCIFGTPRYTSMKHQFRNSVFLKKWAKEKNLKIQLKEFDNEDGKGALRAIFSTERG